MAFHDLLILIIFFSTPTLIFSAASPSYNFPIAKPTCNDTCGNITIPFPFGTTPDCSRSDGFWWMTCNYTFNPPKLFWADSNIQVTEISLDGQFKVLQSIGWDCYARDGSRTSNFSPWMKLTAYFTVNNTANTFTLVGCDSYGYVSGWWLDRQYTTGCIAMCESEDDLVDGLCQGVGCCQSSIPKNAWRVEVDVGSYDNHTRVWEFNNCSYGFYAEVGAFNFTKNNLHDLYNGGDLPMVVDWAIGNATCEEAEANATTYACVSPNSGCSKPENGYGYRCLCKDGFQGNPYLSDGCQDVDECASVSANECVKEAPCKNTVGNYTCSCPSGYSGSGRFPEGCKDIDECSDSSLNNCMDSAICNNTVGGFSCSCPKGYSGNGRRPNGCHKQQDLKIVFSLIGTAFGITALLLAAALLHLELKRRSHTKMKHKFFLQNGGFLLQEKLDRGETSQHMVKIFRSSELQKATNDFHNSMIVGQGGFGTVYKGFLPDNRVVAIKKSKRLDPNESEQFINEVLVLSQINHRNVVRLLGCCLETEVPLLVYEFISNGTLSAHIHNEAKARFLKWETRLKIAAETAGVLAYLHSAASTPIIHRDVKPDNILLDHTFTAKVSDFGASKLVPIDQTQIMTMVQGTFGYLDPEYLQTHQLTEKSDVYSFGVVLVELLTGRNVVSSEKPAEEKNLVKFFLSMVRQECLSEIVDVNIVGNGNMKEIGEVALIAKGCLNVKGEERPSMKEVAMELEGLIVEGKYFWGLNNVDVNAEEMEHLLVVEGEGVSTGFASGEGVGGYDSIRDHVLLPMTGGR